MEFKQDRLSDPDELLTPDEVAAEFQIAPQTLANWRSTGRVKLPFVRIGSRIRYRRQHLQALIEERTVGAVAA